MGVAGIALTVFALGYIVGVWTACVVVWRRSALDDGVPSRQSS
jgi:hypothetical protein